VCATLFYGLICNHPFHDANKRTALLALLYHLQKLSLCLTLPQKRIEDFTVEVAARGLNRYARYKKIAEKNLEFSDVIFIGDYLSRNTRRIERDDHIVTYKQLASILARYGLYFDSARANQLDILRYEERRGMFGLGKLERVKVRVGQIGFHGWTKQVSKTDIRRLRRLAKLDFDHGVDSAAFYDGLDPMQSLLASYQEPLRRLAFR
jgi:death-on-curing protein